MEPESTTLTEELLPTRYSLLSRLQNWEDHESWRVFFDTYWRLIYSVALKVRPDANRSGGSGAGNRSSASPRTSRNSSATPNGAPSKAGCAI